MFFLSYSSELIFHHCMASFVMWFEANRVLIVVYLFIFIIIIIFREQGADSN